MGTIELAAFVFLAGLTASGLAGSIMELTCGRQLAFAEPYVAPSHVLRSLATTAVAGPFMLCNDALSAYRQYRLSVVALASCACTALIWVLALGVVLTSIADAVRMPLG